MAEGRLTTVMSIERGEVEVDEEKWDQRRREDDERQRQRKRPETHRQQKEKGNETKQTNLVRVSVGSRCEWTKSKCHQEQVTCDWLWVMSKQNTFDRGWPGLIAERIARIGLFGGANTPVRP
jgi:hypothetical protein